MPRRRVPQSLIRGRVAPGFEEVRREFQRNFAERRELGAACAVYRRGELVVDLWGGHRDAKTRAPWEEDTLVLVFSTTKGLAALALAVAHSHGLLDYDKPVACYWPEFAQNGKQDVTVRQLLAHQAGLCAIDEPLDLATLADLDALADALAKQKPAWEPGARHGYHGFSLGWYESELIRRVDPRGRSLGQFFRDEIARPLGLELYIGLPPEVADERVATIEAFRAWQLPLHLHQMPAGLVLAALNPWSLTARTFNNPKVLTPANHNRRDVQAIELPASNGIGQVRSIAKAYGVFATGGRDLAIRDETLEALWASATDPPAGAFDEVLRLPTRYSLGFWKPCAMLPFSTSQRAFGSPGAGGSLGFADPEAEIGFAYAPNKLGFYPTDDPRSKALREALYRCLLAQEQEQAEPQS